MLIPSQLPTEIIYNSEATLTLVQVSGPGWGRDCGSTGGRRARKAKGSVCYRRDNDSSSHSHVSWCARGNCRGP